jgi:hypothetical protein
VELKGTLGAVDLHEIVQLIGGLQHSGSLELRKTGSQAVLGFDQGRLVSADAGQEHGLAALAVCARELENAEFRFVEGVVQAERSLDLGPSELRGLMLGVSSGHLTTPTIDHQAPQSTERVAMAIVCPNLGFADDASRHYSRPTALHRCYATPVPSLVTNQEQLDLCLGGRFPTCARFRDASSSPPAANTPTSSGRPLPTPVASEPTAADDAVVTERRWSLPIVAGGTAAALLLVGMAWVLVITAVNRGQQPTAPHPVPEPATPVAIATPAPRPTSPTPPPTSTAAPRPATPSVVPRPPVVPGVRSIVDVRFAFGPAANWLENPPYAAWSAGAYRLQARDAAQFVAVGVPISQDVSKALVSATFRKTGGPPGGGYGLLLRDQGPPPRDGVSQQAHAYVFEAGDVGEFGVWRREGDHWVDLVPWTRSNAVRPGGSPNDLTVSANGARLTFTINGVRVAALEDDVLASGGIGIFVGGDYNEVALDHFSVQLPD